MTLVATTRSDARHVDKIVEAEPEPEEDGRHDEGSRMACRAQAEHAARHDCVDARVENAAPYLRQHDSGAEKHGNVNTPLQYQEQHRAVASPMSVSKQNYDDERHEERR